MKPVVILLAFFVGAGYAQTPGGGEPLRAENETLLEAEGEYYPGGSEEFDMQLRRGMGMRGGGGERLKELLQLSDETAEKIETLGVAHRKSQIALRAKLAAARVDFRSLMRREDPDEQQAMAKQREISGIREEMLSASLAHRFAVAKLLTPGQRKVLQEHRGGMFGRDRFYGPKGERGRRGQGDRLMKHRRDFRHQRMMDAR